MARTQEVRYYGGIDTDYNNPYRMPVSGAASASATGHPDGLLRVDGSYMSLPAGTTPRPVDGTQLGVGAQAGWNGDHLIVTAAPGAALPATTRLNFSLDVASLRFSEYDDGGLTLSANGRGASFGFHVYARLDDVPSLFDGFTQSTDSLGFTAGYHATFHIDLPVSSAGISDPFRLGLNAWATTGLRSSYALHDSFSSKLSLTSITTTDGRLLSNLGDGVTFDSGMLAPGVQPTLIPEPSSFVVIGGLVAAVALGRRSRR